MVQMLGYLVAGLLVTLVVIAPALSPALLVVVLARRVRRSTRWATDYTSWFLVLLGIAPLVYWYGLFTGFLFYKDPEDGCTGRGLPHDFLDTSTSYLPLSRTCSYADGTVVQLVPGWVNPTIAVLGAAAAASLGLIVARARRTREDLPGSCSDTLSREAPAQHRRAAFGHPQDGPHVCAADRRS